MEYPKFKAGDKAWHILKQKWVTLRNNGSEIFPLKDEEDTSYTIEGKQISDDLIPRLFHKEQTLDFSLPEWQPKEGEWCWFWDDNKVVVAVLSKFKCIKYIGSNAFYQNINDIPYTHCAPFKGDLPEHLKEL